MTSFRFETKGLDQWQRRLDELSKQVQALDGQHEVPMAELFNTSFMQRHTQFASFEGMVDASGYAVNTQEDFKRIPDDEWDALVSSRTQFANWADMKKAAAVEYFRKQIDL